MNQSTRRRISAARVALLGELAQRVVAIAPLAHVRVVHAGLAPGLVVGQGGGRLAAAFDHLGQPPQRVVAGEGGVPPAQRLTFAQPVLLTNYSHRR